jgi:hypothetical protein
MGGGGQIKPYWRPTYQPNYWGDILCPLNSLSHSNDARTGMPGVTAAAAAVGYDSDLKRQRFINASIKQWEDESDCMVK